MKYWEKLLLSQRERGKNGLTIPYIIGSQEFLEVNNKDSIEQLFVDIIKNSHFEITLRFCLDLKTLILEKRNNRNIVYFPKFNNEQQISFSVSKSFYTESWESCEAIVADLIDHFESIIKRKTFSAQPNPYGRSPHWTKFSETVDIPFIMKALNGGL